MYSLLKKHNPNLCPVCNQKTCDSHCKADTRVATTTKKSKQPEQLKKIKKKKVLKVETTSYDVLESNLLSLDKEFRQLKL